MVFLEKIGKQSRSFMTLGFIGVAYAFIMVMLGTTLPTPLYPVYEATFGLSSITITIIYAVYAVGVISALLVFGQLSDRIGRRYILLPGVVLSAVSAIVFLVTDNVTLLFVGRILSGFSAGLFTSTATATLVNLVPKPKQGLASMIASAINMLGLGLGPLLAGVLAEYFVYPMRVVFIVHLLMLLPAFYFIWIMEEPVKEKKSFQITVQKLRIPSDVRPAFIEAVIPAFVGFSVLGLFTSVSPAFLQEVIQVDNRAILGVMVFVCFFASSVGQSVLTHTSDHTILVLGSLILLSGILFVGVALFFHSLTLLVIGAVVSGAGQGLSFRAGLSSVNQKTAAQERGEVTSSFFTIAYIALSIPVIGVGILAESTNIQIAGMTFTAIVGILAVIALLYLTRRKT